MPRYTFVCESCGNIAVLERPFSVGPIPAECSCGGILEHDFRADAETIAIDTSECRDHNVIKREKRVFRPGTQRQAERREAAYAKHVAERRSQLKDGNKGSIKHSHAIPADLYHGKIRETGDKNYWKENKNVNRHREFKVG